MKHCLLVVFCSFMLITNVVAQSFTATTDASKLFENSSFTVTFVAEGMQKHRGFSPPKFDDFKVIAGPATTSQYSNVNGRTSQTISYGYTMLATKAGKYRIGPATIILNGKEYQTKPIVIEVVKDNNLGKPAADGQKVFMKMQTRDSIAYLGEQIILDYVIYTQENINQFNLLNEPEYDGFYAQQLRMFNTNPRREIIEGEEYYVKILKRVVLFPQRTGNFTFEPVVANLAIPLPGQRTRGFLSRVRTKSVRVTTEALSLTVRNTPEGAPVSFSGAVGDYRMAASINKRNITTDDAFVVNLEVRGTGDGKTVKAPQQPKIAGMEYYDPNITSDEDIVQKGHIENYKKVEYLIVPKKPGRYQITPEFTYFDIDSNAYVTLKPQTFNVQVSQGTRKVIEDNRDISVKEDFLPARTEVGEFSPFSYRYLDGVFYGSTGLFVLALGFIGFKKYQQVQEDAIDPAEKKRQQAERIALEQLAKANGFLQRGNARLFYEELSNAMNRFLADKFNIPFADFDKQKLVAALRAKGVDDDKVTAYLEILKQCEMALFAGQGQTGMEDTFNKAKQLISSFA